MSITRLQQARQMYALGQRVAKTLDGSRPGYKGRTDANTMSGSGYGAGSSTGSNKGGDNKVDPGFQNALRTQAIRNKTIENQNNKDYGQFFGTRVPTYQTPTFGQKIGTGINTIGTGIVDYVKGGGMLGIVSRGLGNLFDSFTGPKPSEVGNLNMPGYNMLNIAGPVTTPTTPREGNGGDRNLYAATNQYPIPTAVEEEGITTLVNNPDFLQRFRVNNRLRQDKQGELDPQIIAMINNLYTTPTV